MFFFEKRKNGNKNGIYRRREPCVYRCKVLEKMGVALAEREDFVA